MTFTITLVVDNTPVVDKQPFRYPVVVTRAELQQDRRAFEQWMDATTIPRAEFELWMKDELTRADEIIHKRVNLLTRNR